MFWQFAFVILYSVTSSIEFLLQNRQKNLIMTAVAALSASVTFFAAHVFIGSFAVIAAIMVFRILVFVWQSVIKNTLTALFITLAALSIDACILPFLKTEIKWEYVVIAYLIAFCLICLTPFFKNRLSNAEWLFAGFSKKKYIALILPVVPFLTSLTVFFLMTDEKLKYIIILSVLMLLFTASVIILQNFYLQMLHTGELNHAMEKWQNDAKEYMNTIRAQRHDFNIHLHAISGMVAAKDFDKCSEYVKMLVDSASDVNELMPIYDSVIGSMMADMRKYARNKGTDVHYDIKYSLKNIVCSAYECNQIIGNLIQNAIDAVSTDAEKEYGIVVSVTKRNGNSIILIENKCEKNQCEIENIFNLGYTTKKGHEGIGLAMVEKTLNRYSGKIYVKMDDGILRFVIYIPIKITEEG